MKKDENEKLIDQIEGRNSVLELLESDRDINKILIAKGEKHGSIIKIITLAKQRKIVIAEVERQKLNEGMRVILQHKSIHRATLELSDLHKIM